VITVLIQAVSMISPYESNVLIMTILTSEKGFENLVFLELFSI